MPCLAKFTLNALEFIKWIGRKIMECCVTENITLLKMTSNLKYLPLIMKNKIQMQT